MFSTKSMTNTHTAISRENTHRASSPHTAQDTGRKPTSKAARAPADPHDSRYTLHLLHVYTEGHRSNPTEQRGRRLYVAVVDFIVTGGTNVLPQDLSVVDNLVIAASGQSPPQRPGQQGATLVALNGVFKKHSQHLQQAAPTTSCLRGDLRQT